MPSALVADFSVESGLVAVFKAQEPHEAFRYLQPSATFGLCLGGIRPAKALIGFSEIVLACAHTPGLLGRLMRLGKNYAGS